MKTNTQRTLDAMRRLGRVAAIAEKWNMAGFRQDLFGFIDIVALDERAGIIGVQSCGSSYAAHVKKIVMDCCDAAKMWLRCGGKIELWSWRKIKARRGSKRVVWRPRVADIILDGDAIKVIERAKR